MRAGKLRYRIEVQANVASNEADADQYGDVKPRWETIAVRWGDVVGESGAESWQADQARPSTTSSVRLRFYAGLTPRHRLKIGSRILNIESVIDPDGRKREQVLTCREEV